MYHASPEVGAVSLKPIVLNRPYPAALPPGCVWSEVLRGWERLYPTAEQIVAERSASPELSLRDAINHAAERMSWSKNPQPEPEGIGLRNEDIEYDWMDEFFES